MSYNDIRNNRRGGGQPTTITNKFESKRKEILHKMINTPNKKKSQSMKKKN
jgi:hypothetical protein